MRSVLTWIVYGFLPSTAERWMRIIVTGFALILGMALLIYVSVLWRDRLDTQCIVFAKWAEDVVMDKKAFSDSLPFVNAFRTTQGNENVEKASNEARPV